MKDKKRAYIQKSIKQKCTSNCHNKKRYTTENNAIATAWVSYDIDPEKILHYYLCNICNGYHLTSRGGGSSVEIEPLN